MNTTKKQSKNTTKKTKTQQRTTNNISTSKRVYATKSNFYFL